MLESSNRSPTARMQSQTLLSSPKMKRQESDKSRRNVILGGVALVVVGLISVYYFGVFNNRLRGYAAASQGNSASAFHTVSVVDSAADDDSALSDSSEDPALPRLKPESQSRFELGESAEPLAASVLGLQKDTSMGMRTVLGLGEKDDDLKPKKAKKSKKKESEDEDTGLTKPTDGKEVSSFPICDQELSDVVPCLERKLQKKMKLKLTTRLMEHYERHCPTTKYRFRCLVPSPPGYKEPIKWPASRDETWVANVPHTFLAKEKSDQRWMVVEGDKVKFPGGGTHFHDGADKYIEGLGRMLGNSEGDLSLGGKIRTVLDVGCGVASFGGYLLSQNIIAMSVAPNDIHQNQIQFALERGIPAWLGVLGTKRLPFPSDSFELAHCSRCRIDWAQRDGILLLELNRLLRPGGYWAWSAPPAYRDDPESKQIWKDVTDVTTRLCWTIAAKEGQTVIFQKPLDGKCYEERSSAQPPMCTDSDPKPDEAWYTNFTDCINPLPDNFKLAPWPERLEAAGPRLPESVDMEADLAVWKERVAEYVHMIGESNSEFETDKNSFRNVMDFNSNIGGFGAAMMQARDVWVMNAVPPESTTLSTIYDRGMLGIYHNWCEEFSTYPRTYDLLHSWQVLSMLEQTKCSVDDFLLEADRILRPQGYIIFRDIPKIIELVSLRITALRWRVVASNKSAKNDAVSGGVEEQILIAQKTFWEGSPVDKE